MRECRWAFGITQGTIAVYTTTDGHHPHKHCRWQELKIEALAQRLPWFAGECLPQC
jgi:hypothetical protein